MTAQNVSDRITSKQFRESEGVEDWRVLSEGAHTFFRTASFAEGARLAQAMAELPNLEAHNPRRRPSS
jgi:4a-hydroxytetrahydrobiopterin dehydratase